MIGLCSPYSLGYLFLRKIARKPPPSPFRQVGGAKQMNGYYSAVYFPIELKFGILYSRSRPRDYSHERLSGRAASSGNAALIFNCSRHYYIF